MAIYHKLVCLLFVLCAFAVYADPSTLLYSGQVQSGNSILLADTEYDVGINVGGQRVRLLSGEGVWVITVGGTCTQINDLNVCASQYEKIDDIPQVYLTVYTFNPEISLNKTVSPETGDISQVFDVDLTITNTGDDVISAIDFEDSLPPGVDVSRVSAPCQRGDGVITWQGDLDEGDSIECSYRYTPTQSFIHDSKSYASYTYRGNEFNALSGLVTTTANEIVDVNVSLSNESIYLFNETNLSMVMSSSDNDDIPVDVFIIIPNAVEPDSYNIRLEEQGEFTSTYRWTQKLEGDEESEKVPLASEEVGFYPITYYYTYEYEDEEYTTQPESLFLRVSEAEVNTSLSVNATVIAWINFTPLSPEPRERLNYSYHIMNKNSVKNATGLQVNFSIDGEWYDWMSIPLLKPGSGFSSPRFNMTTPDEWSGSIVGEVLVVGLLNGTAFNFTNTTTMTLSSSPILELDANFSVENITVGQVASREVTVENPKEAGVSNVRIQDTLPFGIRFVSGSLGGTYGIRPDSNITVYSYEFYVTDDYNGSPFKTVMNYTFVNQSYGALDSDELTYFPRQGDLDINLTITNETVYLGEYPQIDVLIENNGTDILEDVVVSHILSSGIGVPNEEYVYPVLRPGETITLDYPIHIIQARGNATLKGLSIAYTKNELSLIETSDEINLTVNNSVLSGPALSLWANVTYDENTVTYYLDLLAINRGNQDFSGRFQGRSINLPVGVQQSVSFERRRNITNGVEYRSALQDFVVSPVYQYNITKLNASSPPPAQEPVENTSTPDQGDQDVDEGSLAQDQNSPDDNTSVSQQEVLTEQQAQSFVNNMLGAVFGPILQILLIGLVSIILIIGLCFGLVLLFKKVHKPKMKVDDAYLTDYDKQSVLQRLEEAEKKQESSSKK